MKPLRVFISHNRADNELVTKLHARLNTVARYSPALDLADVRPGQVWRPKVHAWMDDCDVGVFVLSPLALKSGWVRYELISLTERRRRSGTDWPKVIVVHRGVTTEQVDHVFGAIELSAVQAVKCGAASLAEDIVERVVAALDPIEAAVTHPSTRDRLLSQQLAAVSDLPVAVTDEDASLLDWRDADHHQDKTLMLARRLRRWSPGVVAGFLADSPLRREHDGRLVCLPHETSTTIVAVSTAAALTDEESAQRFAELFSHAAAAADGASNPTVRSAVIVSNDEITARACFREARLRSNNDNKTELPVLAEAVCGPDNLVQETLWRQAAAALLAHFGKDADPDAPDVVDRARDFVAVRSSQGRPNGLLLHSGGALSPAHVDTLRALLPQLTVLVNSGPALGTAQAYSAQPGWRQIGPIGDDPAEFAQALLLERAVVAEVSQAHDTLRELPDAPIPGTHR